MHSFSRFFWLLFLVFLFDVSRQAVANEKKSTTILEHPGLARGASGVCGEVLSARCGPADEVLPSYPVAFKNIYIVSEEGNKQLYLSILEWNKLEIKEGELSSELRSRWLELGKQLDLLKNRVSSEEGVTLTKTSAKGAYCSDLLPGKYVIGVWNRTWAFVEVNVRAGEVQKGDLFIPLFCG